MLEINVPIWLLFAAAGIPTLLTAGIFFRELKKSGKAPPVAPEFFIRPDSFGVHVQQQLLEQHVDSIFTAVSAALETERVKLKMLLTQPLPAAKTEMAPAVLKNPGHTRSLEEKSSDQAPLGKSISVLSAQGMTAGQIAQHLDISQMEIALAQKMRGRIRD
jgi:4-hydroxy-L-threonine phosphate dehydrogenase PdxA